MNKIDWMFRQEAIALAVAQKISSCQHYWTNAILKADLKSQHSRAKE